MFEYIERLRKKSDKEKKRFAFLTSFTFSLFILGLWYVATYPTIWEKKELDEKVKKIESGPGESFASTFSGVWGELKANVIGIKESVSALEKGPDYYKATTTLETNTASTSNSSELKTGWVKLEPESSVQNPDNREQNAITPVSTTTPKSPEPKVYGGI